MYHFKKQTMINIFQIGLMSKMSVLRQLKNSNYTNVSLLNKNQSDTLKHIKNKIMSDKKITVSQKNMLLTIVMALEDIKSTGNCTSSSIIYPLLLMHGKVLDYNCDEVIELRKAKYNELVKNPDLKRISEQFPNNFKNITIRQHVQSDLVNQYLRRFESVEEITNDLKQK